MKYFVNVSKSLNLATCLIDVIVVQSSNYHRSLCTEKLTLATASGINAFVLTQLKGYLLQCASLFGSLTIRTHTLSSTY
jgi:hypothetical protein